jgi:hypothetical protein
LPGERDRGDEAINARHTQPVGEDLARRNERSPALVHLRDGPAHLLRFVAVPRVVSRAVGSDAAALLVSIRDLSARLRAAMIETMPLENAAEAYAKMMSGKARFRMVLTVDR